MFYLANCILALACHRETVKAMNILIFVKLLITIILADFYELKFAVVTQVVSSAQQSHFIVAQFAYHP